MSNKFLWLVTADEIDGEHERGIKFLVRANNLDQANAIAVSELRNEWGEDQADEDSTDERINFFGKEIVIKRITIRKVTTEEAIEFFLRGDE